MVEQARTWLRQNSTLIYFLIAQFIAIGAGAASILAYAVKLETRVHIMEHRGAEYTVARMEEMKLRIAALEGQIKRNEQSIDRIVDTMTKRLNINPQEGAMYNRVVISSGHGLKVRGASGILDEVDEARLVTEALADELKLRGVDAVTFHDNTSTSQSQNLETIVAAHNCEARDLDISVHFNAYEQKEGPMGVEVLYLTQQALAADLSEAIAAVGLINRGAKKRTDLYVLNKCNMPTVLLEVCFVDSQTDADIYRDNFDEIIANMASVIVGDDIEAMPRPPEQEAAFHAVGTCSHFGGPDDMGVSASEGLAFHYSLTEKNQHLFLPLQPVGTTGLARRLNAKAVSYLACRWDYSVTSKEMLAGPDMALVRAPSSGREMLAYPADWGPHEEKTGRAADLSPWLMQALDISTDDEVEVIYPWKGY